jgi:ketosteroid isomerase-like protein
MSAESDAIHRTLQEFVSAVNAGDLDQWLETLTDDVVFLPPDEPRIDGKDAVRPWVKENFFDAFRMVLNLSFDELDVVGPMAFAHGRFALPVIPKPAGSGRKMTGKFVYLFRCLPDGSWKFARIIWNYDEPAGGG